MRAIRMAAMAALAFVLASCGGRPAVSSGSGSGDEPQPPVPIIPGSEQPVQPTQPTPPTPPTPPPFTPPTGSPQTAPPPSLLYIATSSTLYRLDRLPPTKIGDFVLPQPQPRWEFVTQGIRDIAVDSRGRIFGLTHHHLYAVDPKTARLTHIGPTSDAIDDVERISNISVIIHQGRDLLIGVNDKAKVFEIDPATAARKQIAEIGGGCGEIAWTSGRLLTLISSPSPGSGPCVAAVDLDRGSSSCIAPLDEWPHSLTSYWGTPMALVGDEMAALHPMTMQLLPSRAPLQLGKPVVAIASGVK